MMLNEIIYSKKYEKTFFALGTINTIVVYGSSYEEALNSACRRVLEVDYRMSAFKNDSDVMQINHYAGSEAQKINIDTFNLLKRTLDFSRASGGAFDITIRPLTELLGFGLKQNYVPERKEIEKVLSLINYQDVILNDKKRTVFLKNKRQSIDLGGIAKGYVSDEVKRVLLQYKIENDLINLRENIITMGHNPKRNCTM